MQMTNQTLNYLRRFPSAIEDTNQGIWEFGAIHLQKSKDFSAFYLSIPFWNKKIYYLLDPCFAHIISTQC